MKQSMTKTFSNPLKGVREKKPGHIAKQLDNLLKNLIRRFDICTDIESERKIVSIHRRELDADLSARGLGLNSKPGCEYLTY